MTDTLAGCNNFTATNQAISESSPAQTGSIAQSGPIAPDAPSVPIAQSGAVQSGAVVQSGAIAQSEPPSPPIAQSRPIAQSGAVVQSRPITKSEALSAYKELVQPCAEPSAVVQSGAIAQSEPPPGPDPSYRNVIANCLKTTFKDYATYELFEISDPRWVSSIKGWNWLVCVRFVDRGRRRNYALLFNGSTVIDGHYAYQTDNCGSQPYAVFEQMGGLGLSPLH